MRLKRDLLLGLAMFASACATSAPQVGEVGCSPAARRDVYVIILGPWSDRLELIADGKVIYLRQPPPHNFSTEIADEFEASLCPTVNLEANYRGERRVQTLEVPARTKAVLIMDRTTDFAEAHEIVLLD